MPWTDDAIQALKDHAAQGLSTAESAARLGVTAYAVQTKRIRLGVNTTAEQQREAQSRGQSRRFAGAVVAPSYRCGHPRTPENTAYGERCKACKRIQSIQAWKKSTEAVDALGAEILHDVRTEFHGSCTVADLVERLGEDHRRIRHAIKRLAEQGLIERGRSAYHRDEWALPAEAMAA